MNFLVIINETKLLEYILTEFDAQTLYLSNIIYTQECKVHNCLCVLQIFGGH